VKPESLAVLLICGLASIFTSMAAPAEPTQPESFTLSNGVRVVVLYMADSTNVSMFTFLPMGLAGDGPGQAQWSHLVEHLVIRTTTPAGVQQVNAETLADHMRLDFYGNVENWEEALRHHVQWIGGAPFTQSRMEAEKLNVIAECDTTAHRLATHKFALAAWAQGCRHGHTHAALKADVTGASLADIERYRDEHLAVLDKVLVCVVGGVDAETLEPAIREQLGTLHSDAGTAKPVKLNHDSRDMTWDLDARHLLLVWPIPSCDRQEHAALMVVGRVLMQRFFADSELNAITGTVLAGTDLITPEGSFFYVSASLRPGATFDEVRQRLTSHLNEILSKESSLLMARMIGQQLSQSLSKLPDPAVIRKHVGVNTTAAMIEANLGLQWGMQEFRFGRHRSMLAERLAGVTAEECHTVAQTYLAIDKCAVCTIRPPETTPN